MFWCKDKEVRVYPNLINLDKIETIEQCRDLIIILMSVTGVSRITPNLLRIDDKTLSELPSLKDLIVE
jgi:hypothetical protein